MHTVVLNCFEGNLKCFHAMDSISSLDCSGTPSPIVDSNTVSQLRKVGGWSVTWSFCWVYLDWTVVSAAICCILRDSQDAHRKYPKHSCVRLHASKKCFSKTHLSALLLLQDNNLTICTARAPYITTVYLQMLMGAKFCAHRYQIK
jgi:hypothetical protein